MAEFIVIEKEEFRRLSTLKSFAKAQEQNGVALSNEVYGGIQALSRIQERTSRIDLNAVSHILTNITEKVIKETLDILEDGEFNLLSDLDDSWVIIQAFKELFDSRQEVLAELGSLNKAEWSTLAATIANEVYERIEEVKNAKN